LDFPQNKVMGDFNIMLNPTNSHSRWVVIFETPQKSLVLYHPTLRQVRTVFREDVKNAISLPWSCESYFNILREVFRSSASLPPPLTDFLLNGYFDKFFPIRQKIGSGTYGSVYRVEHHLAGIRLAVYAVKIVPVGEFNWLRRALNEVRLLEELTRTPHPFVLSYKHCWIEEWQTATFGPKIPCLFILMEYAPLGSLESYLAESNKNKDIKKLTNDEIWQIFLSIVIALRHLHINGIIHRDLKLSNVLVFEDNHYHPLHLRFALCDFGTAKMINVDDTDKRSGATGTIETMAPELLEQGYNGEFMNFHTLSSDIWSLGVILFTLVTRCNPFNRSNGEEMLRHYRNIDTLIESLGLEVNLNQHEFTIIRKMMELKPSRRISLESLLKDSFIYKKIIQFGFVELLEIKAPRVIISSPSLDDFRISVPLAIKCEEKEEISIPPAPSKLSLVDILQAHSVVLLLALLAIESKSWKIRVFRTIFFCFFTYLCHKYHKLTIFVPIIVAIESLCEVTKFNIFLYILIVLISLSQIGA